MCTRYTHRTCMTFIGPTGCYDDALIVAGPFKNNFAHRVSASSQILRFCLLRIPLNLMSMRALRSPFPGLVVFHGYAGT